MHLFITSLSIYSSLRNYPKESAQPPDWGMVWSPTLLRLFRDVTVTSPTPLGSEKPHTAAELSYQLLCFLFRPNTDHSFVSSCLKRLIQIPVEILERTGHTLVNHVITVHSLKYLLNSSCIGGISLSVTNTLMKPPGNCWDIDILVGWQAEYTACQGGTCCRWT